MALTLRLQRGEDAPNSIELAEPGGEVRFGIGRPGIALSGVLRLWSNKSSSDVYIAARSLAGIQKISLHESGDWRLQWVTKAVTEKYSPGGRRQLHNWEAPPEIGPGLTHALVIAIHDDDLVPHPYEVDKRKPVIWMSRPEPRRVARFHVMLARPDVAQFELTGFTPLAAYSLSNGHACLLMA